MKRILIHIPMVPYGEYDIFSEPNPGELLRFVNEKCNGICPNLGNRLWFQGIISEISTPDNQLEYFSYDMTKDHINNSFDMIVAPMANIFSVAFQPILKSLAERFRGITIPVYVIACGVQAKSYDELNELCETLKSDATEFISSVYNTGGEFALRGNFTKEFFERLGFSTAVVTGCPSMYQLGRNLRIHKANVDEDQFRPLFNGNPSDCRTLMRKYKNAEFFDQSVFYHELWNPETLNDDKCLHRMVKQYGVDTTFWLLSDRVKLIPDLNDWHQYLIQNKFNLSYGSRIHGSIMPILAGIPAVLEFRDARTREIAEFYKIPCVTLGAYKKYGSLYALYQDIDYGAFNSSFGKRFDAYEAFLQKCGIVKQINIQNSFFAPIDQIPEQSVNRERRIALSESFERNITYWICLEKLLQMKRKIFST